MVRNKGIDDFEMGMGVAIESDRLCTILFLLLLLNS